MPANLDASWRLDIHKAVKWGRTDPNMSPAVPGDAKADEIKAQLGARALPEQLFAGSGLRLTHEPSGASLEFGALGSLRQWHAAALPPVQVLLNSMLVGFWYM